MLKKILVSLLAIGLMVPTHLINVSAEETETYTPGVTVNYEETGTTATFVYEHTEDDTANPLVKVELVGSFQYATDEYAQKWLEAENPQTIMSEMVAYDAYEYEEGMFAVGADYANYFAGNPQIPYEMAKVEGTENVYTVTIPVTNTQHFYSYRLTYTDGTRETLKEDPANPVSGNAENNSHPGNSIFYVGNSENALDGQENIYPVESSKQGNVEYITYTGYNGGTHYVGVYTPANYDTSKIYKTVYVMHGGGGSESDWFTMGAAQNIMDNLGRDDIIVVSIDNRPYDQTATVGWGSAGLVGVDTNIVEYLIPAIEAKYSVSTSSSDRAICGLSQGALVTSMVTANYPEAFDYLGFFSGGNAETSLFTSKTEIYDELKDKVVYASAGNMDLYMSAFNDCRNQYKVIAEAFKTVGATDITTDVVDGVHDWNNWRTAFDHFMTNVCFKNEEVGPYEYTEGVVVSEVTAEDLAGEYGEAYAAAGYKATFTYINKEATSVHVTGNFQYTTVEAAESYLDTTVYGEYQDAKEPNTEKDTISVTAGTLPKTEVYTAYEYEEGMIPMGADMINMQMFAYDMVEIADGVFQLEMPVASTLYTYTYCADCTSPMHSNGIIDPANPPLTNEYTGENAGLSYFYVGTSETAIDEQEYIFPIEDETKQGSFEFVPYTDILGNTAYLGVYLPANYDENNTYKTIYVSHGGGGDEVEWLSVGSAANIMDNLIAAGEVDENTILVTVNNENYKEAKGVFPNASKNIAQCVVPFIEENYSVSTETKDRAICGLSAGSMITLWVAAENPDMFAYYGIFSSGVAANCVDGDGITYINALKTYDTEGLKDKIFYLAIGNTDQANRLGAMKVIEETLTTDVGVENLTFEYNNGAHDWNSWRAALTAFVKDIVWEGYEPVEDTVSTQTGDTVNLLPLVMMFTLSAVAVTGIVYKKKEEN